LPPTPTRVVRAVPPWHRRRARLAPALALLLGIVRWQRRRRQAGGVGADRTATGGRTGAVGGGMDC
jgi:hypothetical protein